MRIEFLRVTADMRSDVTVKLTGKNLACRRGVRLCCFTGGTLPLSVSHGTVFHTRDAGNDLTRQ